MLRSIVSLVPARWPNLFIVGAARAGTTTLWRQLGTHPDVFMSPVKEPHYFGAGDDRPAQLATFLDADAYLALFAKAHGERYLGEASTGYLLVPGVPQRIRARSPEARVVISLRDPVTRVYSGYWLNVRLGSEKRAFGELVRAGLAPYPYTEHVSRYLDVFGDRVRIVVFEEFAADPRATFHDLYTWLELDAGRTDTTDVIAENAFALPRNRAVAALFHSYSARRAARLVLPPRPRRWLYERFVPGGSPPPLDPETVSVLRERTRADTERLARLLDRPLPWC